MRGRALAGLSLLAALAGCEGRRVTADHVAASAPVSPPTTTDTLPPRPSWTESDDERRLATCALRDARRSDTLPAFFEATCGDARVLWLPATVAQPTRYRAQLALYRTARQAGLDVVPTTARRLDHRSGLGAVLASGELAGLADDPAGRVASAITRLPDGEILKTRSGAEAARWSRMAAQPAPRAPSASWRTVEDWQRVSVLDYVTANLFRGAILLAPDGRVWMIDGSTAFHEHPSARAADQLFDAVKAARRPPPGLADALARLTRPALDAALRSGSYDEWLVHHREIGEVALRARAAHGWALTAEQIAP
ncbi:MAG: hypothetical protein IT374_15540 [Polyangiaceae bacterium]|nr:hypothetical protein [Polyangiaceae bacterium]